MALVASDAKADRFEIGYGMFVIRIFMCLLLVPLFGMAGDGVVFDEWFEDRTLRIDFVF